GNRERGRFTRSDEVRFVRLIPGPIERVWAYLVEGEQRATWLAGGPLEPRVGGRAELFFRHANLAPDESPPDQYKQYHDPGDSFVARVTQCEPPRLLAYTWGGNSDSEVTF